MHGVCNNVVCTLSVTWWLKSTAGYDHVAQLGVLKHVHPILERKQKAECHDKARRTGRLCGSAKFRRCHCRPCPSSCATARDKRKWSIWSPCTVVIQHLQVGPEYQFSSHKTEQDEAREARSLAVARGARWCRRQVQWRLAWRAPGPAGIANGDHTLSRGGLHDHD
jgi:hypothetical protein